MPTHQVAGNDRDAKCHIPWVSIERASEDEVQFIFGEYTLDTDMQELRHRDTLISIQPQVFDLLTYLLRNRERVVSKDDLIAAVWEGRIVSDSTLGSHINAARRAIGDNGDEQKLIRTLARKGVRFVGEVKSLAASIEPAQAARPPSARQPSQSVRPTIAMLPLVNMSGEAQQEYFSDGISEDIITALTRLRWFHVVARNSSFSYKGKAIPFRQIGEELGAGYIVEGSVRKDGERVRITVQLGDVATGSQPWAERYDRQLADVFALQDEITTAIVAAIEPQLYAAENFRAQRKPTDSLDAWDLVMRAVWHFWRVTHADNLASQKLLEHAIAIDPNHAQALAMLAVSHTFGAAMGWEKPADSTPLAERAALAAVRVDDEDAWTHLALACAQVYSGRTEDALAALEAALRPNPNFSLAIGYTGVVLTYAGRSREGLEMAERALKLSPRDPFCAVYYGVAAWAAFIEREYDKAIRLAREGVRLRPDFVGGYRVLTAAAGMAGEKDLARSALRDLRVPSPPSRWRGSRMSSCSRGRRTASTFLRDCAGRACSSSAPRPSNANRKLFPTRTKRIPRIQQGRTKAFSSAMSYSRSEAWQPRTTKMNAPSRQIQSSELIFKPLTTHEEFNGYDELLIGTYLREGIFSESFLPGSDVRRFGVVDEEGRIAGICGLKDLDQAGKEFFLDRIPVSVSSDIRIKEVINVVIRRPYHGSSAFAVLCGGIAEAAVTLGADLLVGITRAPLLKSFVKFGLDPAIHEPMHLLGNEKISDFVIYYDFRGRGAVEYMRARTSHVIEQNRRMDLLRSKYLMRSQDAVRRTTVPLQN